MDLEKAKQVLVLVNRKSGVFWSFDSVRRALDEYWDIPGINLSYQFCQSVADGTAKAKKAVMDGVDSILVVGGDGTVNMVGRVLMGTEVSLGVVPVGSGNGFARHFGIPISPEKAVRALANASVRRIDVGVVNEMPFLITCSMAWDASIVHSFEKSAIRGILPYIFAGMNEFFQYKPQELRVEVDSGEELVFPDPLVFTIANLTQYGGGARIAPHAQPDDGCLELVVALHQDVPKLIVNIGRLFDGTINKIPEVISRRFRSLVVKRRHTTPIQMDGELMDAPGEIKVRVVPRALKVLVPEAVP